MRWSAKQAWTRADEDTAEVGVFAPDGYGGSRAAERRVACSGRAQRATLCVGKELERKGSGKW